MYTLIENADIYTMSPACPRAEAAIIHRKKFVYAGTREGAGLYLAGKPFQTLDAQGCTVIPGFNDAHMHYLHTAMRSRRVELGACRSIEAIIEKLRQGLSTQTDGWVVGEGWNQESFAEKRLPTRQDLDRVSDTVPVVASRACGHIATANSAALALAGVTSQDGILREDEQSAVFEHIPATGIDTQIDAMLAAQQTLYAKGITSVQSDDLGSIAPSDWPAFMRRLLNESDSGRLALRYSLQANCGTLETLRHFFENGLHRLRGESFDTACVKLLTDGSLGAHTAWMSAPYADDPTTAGIALYSDGELTALVAEAARHGLPSAIHAIGDAATEQTLCAFEATPGLRHAVVHAQIMTAEQTIRCGRLGLSIMAQPIFLDADAPIVTSRVGEALAATSYRWRTMLAAGAHVAFSTDCPVEPFDPMPNLYCAITRRGLHGQDAYLPGEAFTLEEALYAYTAAGAYVSGHEAERGVIAPGMLADFAVFDRKLNANEPASLLEMGIAKTYIGGECVFSV